MSRDCCVALPRGVTGLSAVYDGDISILMGKRELVALLSLSSRCLVTIVWLFIVVPRVCLPFTMVVFPNPTHLLFLIYMTKITIHIVLY